MQSRYDFMKEGTVVDEVSGSRFPDPLSLNYLDFKMSDIPKEIPLSNRSITHLWMEADMLYGKPQLDDMVLTLNGVAHKNFLKNGDTLYFPSESDIKRSFMKKKNFTE